MTEQRAQLPSLLGSQVSYQFWFVSDQEVLKKHHTNIYQENFLVQ